MKRFFRLVLAAVMAVGTAKAQAPAGPLEVRLVASKVIAEDGRERLTGAADAKPGDLIEYAATYRNTGKVPLRDVQATLPIPRETAFVTGSARPAGARASLDGAGFDELPLKRRVRRASGEDVLETVPPAEYRALRWRLAELAPGAAATVHARVRVIDDRPAPGGGAPK